METLFQLRLQTNLYLFPILNRSLRISTPHSDSACSSSAESSDCESTSHHHHHHHHHHNFNEAPVEIVPGLFLGNASHSCDSNALQKYNIKVSYICFIEPSHIFIDLRGLPSLSVRLECDTRFAKWVRETWRHKVSANTHNRPLLPGSGQAFSSCHTLHRCVLINSI